MGAYEAEVRRRCVFPHLRPAYIEGLFAEQRVFVEDPSTLKAALCGRRAGKSTAAGRYLVREAERIDGATCLYIALTRPSAKRILWDDPGSGLLALLARFGIEATANHTDLSLSFPNGSRVYLVGADDVQAIDRLRGSAYALAIVDEAASFGPQRLLSLVRDVLRPSTIDKRGTIALVGTPGAALVGLFHDATTNPALGWSTHHWTSIENPHIPDAAAFLVQERRINGWAETHPTYRREYLGEWVRDASGLVYPFDAARNGLVELPGAKSWTRVLGIDYGFGNSTAFVVLGWGAGDPVVYVIESAKSSGLIPSAAAVETRAYEKRLGGFARMVGDVSGLGKGYAEEARQRFALPIEPAAKTDKRAVQELLAGDLQSGRLKIVVGANRALLDEMAVLQWGPGREEEDARFENDLCDAMLYGWRETKAWIAEHELPAAPKNESDVMRERTFFAVDRERDNMDFDSW